MPPPCRHSRGVSASRSVQPGRPRCRLRIHVLLHQARLAAGVHRPRHRWHHPDCCRQYGGGPRRSGGRFPAHRAHGRLDRATRRPLVSVKGSACALPARSGQQAWANASIAVLEGDTRGGFVDRPAGDPRALEMPVCTGAPQRDCPRIRRRRAGHALSTYPNPS